MATSIFSRREFSAAVSKSLALLFAIPGLPTLLDAAKRKPIPDGAIRLNFNENPYGPSPKAVATLDSCAKISFRYPDDAVLELQDAIATKSGVAPENVVLGCGSTEILRAVDATYLASAENVVAADPTFEAVLDYARVLHRNPVKIPLTADHRHDLPKMAAACTSKTGVIYICNPNNPTGTLVTREEMAAFVAAVPPATLILVDEAYNDFVTDPRYASAIALIPQYPNVIVARTFSKIYGMAGMRLGYAIGAKEQIARISAQLLQDNVNAAVVAAALASLHDEPNVVACRERLVATRTWLCDALAHDGRSFIPSHANFVMIDMGSDVLPYIEEFKSRNIYVGRKFPSIPNFLRVTIGTQSEIESFVAALRQLAPASAPKAA
ncbi:MAG TPA: histidinol-phosphate transaminase [Candidatus Acidoferrales bacterium]